VKDKFLKEECLNLSADICMVGYYVTAGIMRSKVAGIVRYLVIHNSYFSYMANVRNVSVNGFGIRKLLTFESGVWHDFSKRP
jgi:hypothetical protein